MWIVKFVKPSLVVVAVAFVAVQFVRPAKNLGTTDPTKELSAAVSVPAEVGAILRESCFDCHSNATRYPWYAEVMPVGWYLADHVDEGKAHLNFSEFAAGSLRRQYHKLEEITEQVDAGEMPLPSYLLLHGDATLSGQEKETLNRWVAESRKWMRERYPADSLERPRRQESGGEKR